MLYFLPNHANIFNNLWKISYIKLFHICNFCGVCCQKSTLSCFDSFIQTNYSDICHLLHFVKNSRFSIKIPTWMLICQNNAPLEATNSPPEATKCPLEATKRHLTSTKYPLMATKCPFLTTNRPPLATKGALKATKHAFRSTK